MSYTINKTNRTIIATVQDGTVNTKSLDITLVGKNYSGYGEIFNENFVKMLEHFSNTTPPSKPLTGQLYFNSALRTLRVYTGVGADPWKSVGIIENSNSRPAGYNAGDLWWKTDEERLYAYSGAGTSWTLVGPLSSKAGVSGAVESTVLRASTGSDVVVKITSDGTEVAIVSGIDNTTSGGTKSSDPSYNDFPYIKKGITLPAITIGDTSGISYQPYQGQGGYILWGTSASTLGLISAATGSLHTADEYLLSASLASLTSKISVNNDNGVIIGTQGSFQLHITDSTVGNITNTEGDSLRFNVGTSNSTSTSAGSFYNIFSISAGANNSSFILPNSTATVYIGTATQAFDYIYVNTATFTTVTSVSIAGTTIKDSGNRVITSFTLNANGGLSGGGTVTGPSGTLAFTNTGILSVTGTANQVSITSGQNPTFSLPQNIDTGATVTFNRVNGTSIYDNANRVLTSATRDITLTDLRAGISGATIHGDWVLEAGATLESTYADLAERYASDAEYEPGTVLVIGGTQEVTVATQRADVARAGIVSSNPAFTLNAQVGDDKTHPYIALKGRVPCKVTGMIKKGDLLVTSTLAGHAEAAQFGDDSNAAIGRALENFVGESGVIEVMVI
jgi:hypothetical protein